MKAGTCGAKSTQSLRGQVETLFFSSPGFSAGRIRAEDKTQAAFAGKFCVRQGDPVVLHGRWGAHEKYGRQFQAEWFEYDTAPSAEGLAQYLAAHPALKGIGPAKARRIAQQFAGDFERALAERPEEIAKAAAAPLTTIQTLAAEWDRVKTVRSALTFLSAYGLTHHQVTTLVEKHGNGIIALLNEDPYHLVGEIRGMGFKRVDKVARQLGTPKAHPARIRAGLLHCVHEALDQGNCWVEWQDLVVQALEMLVMDNIDARANIEHELKSLCKCGLLHCESISGRFLVAMPSMVRMERELANIFSQSTRPNPAIRNIADLESLMAKHAGSLNDDQQKAIRNAISSRISLISGGAGTGKAQPLDSKILTPTGWKQMKDIEVDDLLIGANGTACKVTGVFPQGNRDVFRVTMTDGSSTECCEEHLWLTRSQKDRDRKRPGSVKSLKTIRDSLTHANGKRNHWIPIVHPVEFERQKLPIDPYVLGLLLGDGCFSKNICGFTSPEPMIIETLKSLLPVEVTLTQSKSRPIDYRIWRVPGSSSNSIIEALKQFHLHEKKSHEKFIPEIYKFSPSSQRLCVLQGLLDTNGYAYGHGIEFSTASLKLAHDVRFLVQSLGGICHLVSQKVNDTDKGQRKPGRESYRLHLCLPGYIEPFRLARKACAYVPRAKYHPRRAIEKVEFVGTKPTQCIAVNAADQLYVTDDFIVTHNTYTLSALASIFESQGLKVTLTAPTGKAAKRMHQVTGRLAQTIHRLLEYNGLEFLRGVENPLEYDVVILDEVSMVDVPLFWRLFQAIDFTRTAVVLVGDHNQLPPVGPGNPLRDLIQTRAVPTTILSCIIRQAGVLKDNCTTLLRGQVTKTSTPGPAGYPNWVLVDKLTEATAVHDYLQTIFNRALSEKLGFDLIRDVQVLTPTNKGPLGTQELNISLQRLIQKKLWGVDAPPSLPGRRPQFLLHDKVIQSRNNYNLGVMNGTMGVITEIQAGGRLRVLFEGHTETIEIDAEERIDLQLAYALSIHRAQGSEFPCTVLIMHKSHSFMHHRGLFYTGVTRAQKTVIILGDQWGIRNCASRCLVDQRKTFLPIFLSPITEVD